MFERFPAESVRALFVARAIAHKAGRDSIEIPHLVASAIVALEEGKPSTAAQAKYPNEIVIENFRLEPFADNDVADTPEVPFSHEVKRLLNGAVHVADRLGHHRIRPEHLLLAVFDEPSREALQDLELAGLNKARLAESAATGVRRDDSPLQQPTQVTVRFSQRE